MRLVTAERSIGGGKKGGRKYRPVPHFTSRCDLATRWSGRADSRAAQLGSVDEVLTILARSFRGATAYPRGWAAWRDDERGGTLLQEEPGIVSSYVAEAALMTPALSELHRTLSRMGLQANRGVMGVVIDGKYYGITEYVEE